MNTTERREYKFQRKLGKIYDYDEIMGMIATDEKTYEFSYMGLDEDVKNGDIVTFYINDDMAVDIKKYKSKSLSINNNQEK